MDVITFEIKSLLKFQLDLVKFPNLSSPKRLIQKGIGILKQHTPKVLDYLSKQKILSELTNYKIILKTDKEHSNHFIKNSLLLYLSGQ